MWALFALLSAVFAALTGILAKIGMEGINSNLATAIRTVVVLVMAWGLVFLTGKQAGIADITTRGWVFLALSGVATGLYRGQEALTRAEARQVVDGLLAFGPRSVVITSGQDRDTGRHEVWGYDHGSGEYFSIPYRLIQVHFPGTGDIFSAVLAGSLLNGQPFRAAVKRAMDVVEQLIFLEQDEIEKNKGIRIERFLDLLKE